MSLLERVTNALHRIAMILCLSNQLNEAGYHITDSSPNTARVQHGHWLS